MKRIENSELVKPWTGGTPQVWDLSVPRPGLIPCVVKNGLGTRLVGQKFPEVSGTGGLSRCPLLMVTTELQELLQQFCWPTFYCDVTEFCLSSGQCPNLHMGCSVYHLSHCRAIQPHRHGYSSLSFRKSLHSCHLQLCNVLWS